MGRANAQGVPSLVSAHWGVWVVKLGLWLQVPGQGAVRVLVPVSWYVGLSPGPLVGKAMSQGVCGLGESQGS